MCCVTHGCLIQKILTVNHDKFADYEYCFWSLKDTNMWCSLLCFNVNILVQMQHFFRTRYLDFYSDKGNHDLTWYSDVWFAVTELQEIFYPINLFSLF